MSKIVKLFKERFTKRNFSLFMMDIIGGAALAFMLLFGSKTVVFPEGDIWIREPYVIIFWYILWRAWMNFTKK